MTGCGVDTRPPTGTTSPGGKPPHGRRASSRCRPAPSRPAACPRRVKCLHALVAHELAAGDVNPFGREALDAAGAWWLAGPCVPEETE